MNSVLSQVVDEILRCVSPGPREREKVRSATDRVRALVLKEVERRGLKVVVEVGGSVAKDTWLSSDVDIDLFMLFDTDISKKELGELGLDIAKRAFSTYRQRERYAEHAYLEVWVRGVRANIVPCYKAEPGRWLSSADRSPYHTRYVIEKLKAEPLENDIRAFKKFVKNVGAYGAEIRVGGLSGYLSELLVLNYGSFLKTVEAISKWRFGEVIYPLKPDEKGVDEIRRAFSSPLIVVDPVDQNRNVAAAVSRDRMSELVAAAKLFLRTPSLAILMHEGVEIPKEHLVEMFSSLEYNVIALEVKTGQEIPDILWGELLKTKNALKRLLEANDFTVLKSDLWSDEIESSVMVFGLEAKSLSRIKRHMGPPGDADGVVHFLEKHRAEETVGPWIENGRWIVGSKRRFTSAEALLKDALSNGGQGIGVSQGLMKALPHSRIFVDAEILSLCAKESFACFIAGFFKCGPRWLQVHHRSSSLDSST